MENRTKVEFIESYIKGVNGSADYQWHDNHGELIRCANCTYYRPEHRYECYLHEEHTEPDGFCSWAVKKEV